MLPAFHSHIRYYAIPSLSNYLFFRWAQPAYETIFLNERIMQCFQTAHLYSFIFMFPNILLILLCPFLYMSCFNTFAMLPNFITDLFTLLNFSSPFVIIKEPIQILSGGMVSRYIAQWGCERTHATIESSCSHTWYFGSTFFWFLKQAELKREASGWCTWLFHPKIWVSCTEEMNMLSTLNNCNFEESIYLPRDLWQCCVKRISVLHKELVFV